MNLSDFYLVSLDVTKERVKMWALLCLLFSFLEAGLQGYGPSWRLGFRVMKQSLTRSFVLFVFVISWYIC